MSKLFLKNAKQKEQENLFLLNYVSNLQGIQMPNAEQVPTLVPADKMAILQNGDTEPYFKIQAIKYPVEGDGGYYYEKAIYTENFFREFVNLTNTNPMPGSKKGHAWMSTGKDASDFYMVGGKVESNGDGTGTVYFKNYIPKMGYETTNEGFLRDLKVNIINFSLVTRGPRYEVLQDQNKKEYINILSPGVGNRNDAVELDLGRMAQVTNSLADSDFAKTVTEQVRALIANGKIDAGSPWTLDKNKDKNFVSLTGNEDTIVIKNGKVYRSALRSIANRATHNKNMRLADLANALLSELDAKRKEQKNMDMDKEEVLKLVQNMVSTGTIGLIDLQNAGLGALLMTEEGKKALEVVNGFKAIGVADPLTAYTNAAKLIADSEKNNFAAKLTEKYGPEKLENGSPNKLRVYADRVLKDVKLGDLENACAELDKDPIMLEFAGQRADGNSMQNAVYADKSKLGGPSTKQAPRTGVAAL